MTGRCMIVDISRCVGCQTCVVSCKAAAGTGPGLFRCVMRTLSEVSEAEEKAEERRFWEPLPLRALLSSMRSCALYGAVPCRGLAPHGRSDCSGQGDMPRLRKMCGGLPLEADQSGTARWRV